MEYMKHAMDLGTSLHIGATSSCQRNPTSSIGIGLNTTSSTTSLVQAVISNTSNSTGLRQSGQAQWSINYLDFAISFRRYFLSTIDGPDSTGTMPLCLGHPPVAGSLVN